MIKELITDEAILSQECVVATAEDAAVATALIDPIESMKDECACLAANQIGVTKAIIAYQDEKDRIHVMYNPSIKRAMKRYVANEGCLTREEPTVVERYAIATITYEVLINGKLEKRERKFTDWTAQLIQHGIDHGKGELV